MSTTLLYRSVTTGLASVTLACLAATASAQELDAGSATVSENSPCSASTRASDSVLRVVCGETGFLLGNPTSHTLVAAPSLKATIVDTSYGEDRRVWLIATGEDGQPVLEEITGALAQAAGRGATFDLSGLTIDLAPVPGGGAIAVGPASAAGERGMSATFDLAAMVGRVRTARSAIAAQQ